MASPQPAPSDSTQKLYNISTQSSDEYTYDGREAREGDRIPAPNTLNPFPTEDPQYALKSQVSPSQTRAQERRLDDDLAMLQAERQVTTQQQSDLHRSDTVHRTRSRRTDPVDEFDVNTNPVHEQNAVYRPPENPSTRLARIFKKIHNSSFLVRYFMYIIPVTGILLIPLLFGALLFKDAHVGGVQLMWFSIWLEIIWLTLWAGRIVAKMIPWPLGLISSLFTNNSKKWRDMGKQLELPATLFFWWLGIEISFLPTMRSHVISNYQGDLAWQGTVNTIIVCVFIGVTLNMAEKTIIQLIAINFHLRTYSDRIEINKFQIGSLVKLYQYSKQKIEADDSDFEDDQGESGPGSGSRTPMQYLEKAQKGFTSGFRKVGDVAGKVAGDFTGKQITQSTHPHQVVLVLLNSTGGSQVLARRLYRTFARPELEVVTAEEMKPAFESNDEAEAAFTMFDKDLNGDISMEELEAVCVEIGRERKSITASLKDLDSVVSKLDGIFVFVVICVTILVFITLISTSAAGVLTSAGSSVLALSWLFSATAQEFLQSVIFVFVKHPFDVGDRVSVYGNTGATMKGDDYFVKEISLLYTEFKKMEGHVVQAPNSYLNTLFILNMRRSGGLAEALPLTVKFGTTLDQIDQLRNRLLDFVKVEKREFQGNILTEIREVVEAYSVNLNVVFFYKSNWQNELLRLQRRNKFICALMVSMQEIGIEGPRARHPGAKEALPFYVHSLAGAGGAAPGPHGKDPAPDAPLSPTDPHGLGAGPTASTGNPPPPPGARAHHGSILRRPRGESASTMARRVDFSLGMKDISSGNLTGDVYDDRRPVAVPTLETLNESNDRGRNSTSRSRPRASQDSVGRSSAHEHPFHGLRRARTDAPPGPDPEAGLGRHGAGGSVLHRNHFFSRGGCREPPPPRDHDEQRLMEQGMAAIPEGGNTTATATPGTSRGSDVAPQLGPAPPMPDLGLQRNLASRGQDGYEMRQLRE